MIETYLVIALLFGGGGWWVGHKDVSVTCAIPALIEANCTNIPQLTNDSFGATTTELVQLAGQYKKCRAAALSK
jgi:hypothetical protein